MCSGVQEAEDCHNGGGEEVHGTGASDNNALRAIRERLRPRGGPQPSIRGGHRGVGGDNRHPDSIGHHDNYPPHRRPPHSFQEGRRFKDDYPEYPPDYPPDYQPQGRRQGGFHGDQGDGGRGSNPRGGGAWQQVPFCRGIGRAPGQQRVNRDEEECGGGGGWSDSGPRSRWGRSDSPGEEQRGRWGRGSSPGEQRGGWGDNEPITNGSPVQDTPLSPVQDTPLSPEMNSPPWPGPKTIPMEAAPKAIPLERPMEKPKLSETERKNKLLSLKSKLEGKSAKEFSPSMFVSSANQDSPRIPQEPDSQRSEPVPVPSLTPVKTQRLFWSSPTDSPPGLSIAESPMSPDTQTASPDQMPSSWDQVAVDCEDILSVDQIENISKQMKKIIRTGRVLIPLQNIWWRNVKYAHQAGIGVLIEDETNYEYYYSKNSLMDSEQVTEKHDCVTF